MFPRWRQTVRASLLAFAASVALYGAVAATIPFYDKGEPREALVVQAMLRGDGVILPRPDGQHVPSKPPLFHWLAALAAAGGGRAGELAMRAPSVVLAALGVALTFAVAMHGYGAAAGLLSAVVLASSFEWMRAATQSRVDMTLTFFMISAILAWHRGTTGPESRWAVRAGYLAAAAAVLTKGPVGVVLPALVVAADALRRREPRSLLRLADAPGALGMLVLCAGWYGLAWTQGGTEFASRHLVHENLQRFVGWGSVAHRHPALYYVPALAGGFLPWTLALPVAAGRAWRRPERLDPFLLVWIVTVLAFYSLAAGKRSTYLLPLFPPLAIFAGAGLAALAERSPTRRARLVLLVASVLGFAGAVTFGLDLAAPLIDGMSGFIHGTDRARLPAALVVVHQQRWAIAATLAVIAATLIVLASPRSEPGARVGALATAAIALTVGLTAFGTHPVANKLTARPFAERVAAHLRPSDLLCSCGELDGGLRFYLGRPVPSCGALGSLREGTRVSAIQPPLANAHGARRRYRVRPLPARGDAERPCVALARTRES